MKTLLFALLVLLFSPCYAQSLMCGNARTPCLELADRIDSHPAPLDGGMKFYTGSGFFIDVFPGFRSIQSLRGGVIFIYDEPLRNLSFVPVPWNYANTPLFGNFKKLYVLERGDVEAFFYQDLSFETSDTADDPAMIVQGHEANPPRIYQAFIKHSDMGTNRAYLISASQFSREEFERMLNSITLGTPHKKMPAE